MSIVHFVETESDFDTTARYVGAMRDDTEFSSGGERYTFFVLADDGSSVIAMHVQFKNENYTRWALARSKQAFAENVEESTDPYPTAWFDPARFTLREVTSRNLRWGWEWSHHSIRMWGILGPKDFGEFFEMEMSKERFHQLRKRWRWKGWGWSYTPFGI